MQLPAGLWLVPYIIETYFLIRMVFFTFLLPQEMVSVALPDFFFAVNLTLLPVLLLNFRSFFPFLSSFQRILPFSPLAFAVSVMDFFCFTVVLPLTFREGLATVIVQEAVRLLPSVVVAVMVVLPAAFAVTFPFDTVATAGLLLRQITFWETLDGAIVAFRLNVP